MLHHTGRSVHAPQVIYETEVLAIPKWIRGIFQTISSVLLPMGLARSESPDLRNRAFPRERPICGEPARLGWADVDIEALWYDVNEEETSKAL